MKNALQAEKRHRSVACNFIIRRGFNTSWIKFNQLEWTDLVGDIQETNNTDGASAIVDEETPVQLEDENNLHQLQTINPNRCPTNTMDLQGSRNQRNTR